MINNCSRCLYEGDAVLRPKDAPCNICQFRSSKQEHHNIVKTTSQIKAGLEGMMDRFIYLSEYLANTTAKTENECASRLRLIEERRHLALALRALGLTDSDLESKYYSITIV